MSVDRWNTVLVLGGIRSGKSAFAESLVEDAASVRYVATAVGGEDDPEWLARIEEHQRRRPQSWSTEETGADPRRLATVLAEAKPDDTLLVDDMGGWVAALLDPGNQPQDDVAMVDGLAAAVRDCAARVVVVSPEVGLSLVPTTPVGRAFADALGTTNQALASACDRVALVVAGQPTWLKPADGAPTTATRAATAATAATATVAATTGAAAGARPASAPSPAEGTAPAAPAVPPAEEMAVAAPPAEEMAVAAPPAEEMAVAAPPAGATRTGADEPRTPPPADSGVVIGPGMDLPMPDADAGPDAHDRLTTLDLPGTGLGPLREVVEFAAGTQNTVRPRPWTAVRVLVISGAHDGGAAAGVDGADVERRVAQIAAGEGALIRLAGQAGADVTVVRVPASGAMEDGPVLDADAVETALHRGWQLAGAAGDDGRDALVLASAGAGTDAVAAAVLAATTGAEPAAVLPRVVVPGGSYDDHAWMTRCAAVRDALHRIRHEPRGAQDILAQLGGADLAVATGVLLGAAARRIPVLLDGPVGIAAGLIARDLGSQTRHWCLLPDAGTHALVRQGADVLGLSPVLELGLDLGEGANALAVLPLLRAAVGLASALPVHPALLAEPGDDGLGGDDPGDDDADFAEPVPDGPGPTSV